MPYLKEENPRLPESVSRMALRLRADEEVLAAQAKFGTLPPVETLKAMPPAIRRRCLEGFLKENGVKEPEEKHIVAVEGLLYSGKPSARVGFPGGVTIARQYDRLAVLTEYEALEMTELQIPGATELPGWRITCTEAEQLLNTADAFTVIPEGTVILRSRQSGDRIRLSGGSKSLKKLFIDRKIPAAQRESLPVLSDETGILGVYGIGVHQDRRAETLPAITIHIEKIEKGE
jgi:tRNA(Ile)-lysidine synthase